MCAHVHIREEGVPWQDWETMWCQCRLRAPAYLWEILVLAGLGVGGAIHCATD